jgi:type 2 lantibiotic biosynthesis protein LanM
MDPFFERFAVRAATIDELLSDAFEHLPGQKADTEIAARRLSAWCRSCASGDWILFSRRLARDGLTIAEVLPRLATVRCNPSKPIPQWVLDAQWIEQALRSQENNKTIERIHAAGEPQAFEHLIAPVVEMSEAMLWPDLPPGAAYNLAETAIASLCHSLTQRLSDVCAPVLYEWFISSAKNRVEENVLQYSIGDRTDTGSTRYNEFISEMRTTGLRRLFETKPVLLRLIASVTRQWIETSREFISRLHADLPDIREQVVSAPADSLVACVEGDLSDLHNFGRSVQLLHFTDGSRILYKPKDLRLDAHWFNVVDELNVSGAPIDLRAVRVLARDGYGWTEFIDHTDCSNRQGFQRYFRRAGAWLCLLHIFAATDMHEENMIAAGDYPVPIDLEMILQAAELGEEIQVPEKHAVELAGLKVAESVMMTGLLPDYVRSEENTVLERGGLNYFHAEQTEIHWENVNTDSMRPIRRKKASSGPKNIPEFEGEQARLGDHIDALIAGFEAYANFIYEFKQTADGGRLFDPFAGLTTRIIQRPTRFYSLLLERLKDHRNMKDGAEWSAHLDFIARLAEWDEPEDSAWPLLKSERAALAELNVPYFMSPTNTNEIGDISGTLARTSVEPGLQHAQERFDKFDREEIAWQVDVIRLSTSTVLRSDGNRGLLAKPLTLPEAFPISAPDPAIFLDKAADISRSLSNLAIRSGPGAAWIGLDWLGDSEFCRLLPLGPDFYNGAPGICIFLAAYAKAAGDEATADLSLAGIATLRHNLHNPNAARLARALGLGGASGVGSVVYSLTVLSALLGDENLLADAIIAASLFTADLIAADKLLDVIGGSAGGILGLLKLYRMTQDREILDRAAKCGDHLMRQHRIGPSGKRSWVGLGMGDQPLNGMAHGAAGYAYALASLAEVTGRQEFADAAQECIAFENASFSSPQSNWPSFGLETSNPEESWPCQWCHGAGGIGLARIGTLRQLPINRDDLRTDILRAVNAVKLAWPYSVDTLCCGSMGNAELLYEAGLTLERPDLCAEASQRIMAIVTAAGLRGDYLWTVGDKRFSLGLFRGLAGVGYTLLRQVDPNLPNVLIWE